MTKEDIKKAICDEFPGKNNTGLRKHLFATVDGNGSLELACRYSGLGATSQASIDKLIHMQNELED